MRSRLHALAIAAAVALPHAASVISQSLNPPYLSEMPSVARVKAEIKGTDPVDTSARQMGALWQLMEIINTLAGPRWKNGRNLLPDEERVKLRYKDAWQQYQYKVNAPPPEDEPRWRKLREVYEKDLALRNELLQRFFSAEFRTAYSHGTGTRPAQSAVAAPATPRSAPAQPAPPARAGSGPKPQAAAAAATVPAPGSIEHLLKQAADYRTAGDFPRAIEMAKKAVALDGSRSDAHLSAGYGYYFQDKYADALPFFKEAVRLSPSNDDNLFMLGVTYYHLKQHQLALSTFQHAAQLNPRDPQEHRWIGNAYAALRQHERAIPAYRRAIELQPDLALAYTDMARALASIEEHSEAIKALQEAVRLKPDDDAFRVRLAAAYLEVGRKEDAVAVQRDLEKRGSAKAKELKEEIQSWFPDGEAEDPEFLMMLAGRYADDGKPDGALRYSRRLLLVTKDPAERAWAHSEIGDALVEMKKGVKAMEAYEQSAAEYQKAISAKPQEAGLHLGLGRIFLTLGRKEAALRVQRGLLRLDAAKAKELLDEINKSK